MYSKNIHIIYHDEANFYHVINLSYIMYVTYQGLKSKINHE